MTGRKETDKFYFRHTNGRPGGGKMEALRDLRQVRRAVHDALTAELPRLQGWLPWLPWLLPGMGPGSAVHARNACGVGSSAAARPARPPAPSSLPALRSPCSAFLSASWRSA